MEDIIQTIKSKINMLNSIDCSEEFSDKDKIKALTERYDILISIAKNNEEVDEKKIIRYREHLEDEFEYFVNHPLYSEELLNQTV